MDPNDPEGVAGALANGISPEMITSAQQSPVWKYVMQWKIALPLHIEFRTMPMLFYVPPLLPVLGRVGDRIYEHSAEEYFTGVQKSRLPMKYLAALLTAGNVELLEGVMRKLMAVRLYKQAAEAPDCKETQAKVKKVLHAAHLSAEEAEAIYRLTSLSTPGDRYVMPPIQREEAMGPDLGAPEACKGSAGLGFVELTVRGG